MTISFAGADQLSSAQSNLAVNEKHAGSSLKSFCQSQMAQNPQQLAEQYKAVQANQTPQQVAAFKEVLKFCIANGYISEGVLQ